MKQAQIEVTMIDRMGGDLSVVNSARVSFSKTSNTLTEGDSKLIRYLAEHEHTSPFNHASASFRVKAPVFVARQLVKHKFLPWNEQSRRYIDDAPEFYMPHKWRKRADNVKQGSSEEPVTAFRETIGWYKDEDGEPVPDQWLYHSGDDYTLDDKVKWAIRDLQMVYEDLLASGVCPEQARMVLPQNMMTEWIWSGSLGAWANMCRLRLDPHAQKETREVAEKISAFMAIQFPVSWEALV